MGVSYLFGILLMWMARDVCGDTDILVTVEQGTLSGSYVKASIDNGYFNSFKGIPYAEPPVGPLRFKDPQPPKSWKGVRSAKEHGAICPQLKLPSNALKNRSEDCLFLNVYSPNITSKPLLPVIVFFHGGAYKLDSGDDSNYGPDFFITQNLVVVTVNYRLDAFGFLSMGTKEVPGNAALKDQNLALQWVNKNIAKFGGDPDNVTIMGQSAGSASVTYHIISPKSAGLFKRAICLSGVVLNDFTIPHYPRRRAYALGKTLGCNTNNDNELLNFLQNVSIDKLINQTATVLPTEEISQWGVRLLPFVPVTETDVGQENIFLDQDPLEALNSGNINKVDVMLGYTAGEMMTIIPTLLQTNKINTYDRYPQMFVPPKIEYTSNYDKVTELSEKIINYYFGNKTISPENMPAVARYMSDTIIVYDVHRFARKLKNNVYFYKFAIQSKRNYYAQVGAPYNISGPAHSDDLLYMFDAKRLNLTLTANTTEYNMVKLTTGFIANFARYGNPTPGNSTGLVWPTYDSEKLNYLNIANTPTIETRPDYGLVEFWNSLHEYAGIDF